MRNINERREYRLRYVVSDVFGNQTVREFTVLGTPEAWGLLAFIV